MFTVQQIKAAHAKVKSGADFPAYIQEIKGMGLTRYEFMVADGSTNYYGAVDNKVDSPGIYPPMAINKESSPHLLKQIITEHQQGKTDFLTFCTLVAGIGVHKWVVDAQDMLCTYYNINGNKMLGEPIPQAGY